MLFTLITEQEKQLPLFVTGIGVQDNQEHVLRSSGYFQYQWTYCTKGSGVFIINGKQHMIHPHTGFFFSPDIPHEYYALKEPWETYWITFHGADIAVLLNLFSITLWEVFTYDDASLALHLFDSMEQDLKIENPEKVIETSVKLYQFLFLLKKATKLHSYSTSNQRLSQLNPVLSYMAANYHRDISLEDLAEQISVSSYYLCKLFKQTFLATPFQYLIQIRLQRAKQLLIQQPALKIRDIAAQVGYSDISYFCSIFKKQEGISPLTFRKLHGIYP